MIKTIIVEDEINASASLEKMLAIENSNIKIIAKTGFVREAVALIKSKNPHLIFLDIQLEDGTCFEILKQFDIINFKIIFTTAHSEYAINAFKFSAIDYLLKPIDPLELKEALKRVTKTIKNETEHKELLGVLNNNIEKKIVLKTTEQRYIFNLNEIIRLEADGAYTLFVTSTNKVIVSKNLKYYQELLDSTFLRPHQSHLVNSKHIIKINDKGELLLSNNDLIPISTRKKAEIIQFISYL